MSESIKGPSPASEITPLARALSYSSLSQFDQPDFFQSQTSVHRSKMAQPDDVSPCAVARVLVINTGGTIGMMYHNKEMTPLTRALSYSSLSQLDQPDFFQSQTSVHRSKMAQPGRQSSNSIESLDVCPCAEALVMVINPGETIGMMYHNN
ncbi:unnamed protein product, partial [Coregonus sp. 'balchen']